MAIKVGGPVAHQQTQHPTSTLLTRRVMAGLVDLAIVFVPALLLVDGEGQGGVIERLDLRVLLAVCAGVSIVGLVVPTVTGGRTPGKLLFGLSVALESGGRPSIRHHALRAVAALADLMPGVVPGLTGFAVAASSPRKQRLGDRLAGTTVIDLTKDAPEPTPDNHLNQHVESTDNGDIRPAFSVPEPSSEVFDMSSADSSVDESTESGANSSSVDSAPEGPVDDAATEITEVGQLLEIDVQASEPSDVTPSSEQWTEGIVSTFTVEELTDEQQENAQEESGQEQNELEEPASEDVGSEDFAEEDVTPEVASSEEVSSEEMESDSTTIEAASPNVGLGDTNKSRLVEATASTEPSASTSYPLPSHRRTADVQSTPAPAALENDAPAEEAASLPEPAEVEVAAPIAAESIEAEAEVAEEVEEEEEATVEVAAEADQPVESGVADEVESEQSSEAETDEAEEVEAEKVEAHDEPAQSSDADPAAPVWSEDWNAWICWNDAQQAWVRYDSAIGEWLSMEAEAAEV